MSGAAVFCEHTGNHAHAGWQLAAHPCQHLGGFRRIPCRSLMPGMVAAYLMKHAISWHCRHACLHEPWGGNEQHAATVDRAHCAGPAGQARWVPLPNLAPLAWRAGATRRRWAACGTGCWRARRRPRRGACCTWASCTGRHCSPRWTTSSASCRVRNPNPLALRLKHAPLPNRTLRPPEMPLASTILIGMALRVEPSSHEGSPGCACGHKLASSLTLFGVGVGVSSLMCMSAIVAF